MRRVLSLLAALALAGCDSFATEPADFAQGNIAGSRATLRIVNETSSSMTVYFSPCTQADYGEPRGTVAAYRDRSWSLDAGCWDVAVSAPPYTFTPERVTLRVNQVNTISYSP